MLVNYFTIVHTCLLSFNMYIDVYMRSVTMLLVYQNKDYSFNDIVVLFPILNVCDLCSPPLS
jgi:hypothetical protein